MRVAVAWRGASSATRWVLGAYLVLSVVRLSIGATTALTERHQHPGRVAALMVAVALVLAALLVALVRQQRWAWIVLLALDLIALPSYAEGSVSLPYALLNVPDLLMLLSPPMWRYIWRRSSRPSAVSPSDSHAAA